MIIWGFYRCQAFFGFILRESTKRIGNAKMKVGHCILVI